MMTELSILYCNIAFQNTEIKFSYLKENTYCSSFEWQDASNRRLVLTMDSGRMSLQQCLDGSTRTTLASNTAATSTANQWYDVHVVMDRGKVEVWRRVQGASSYSHIFTVTNNAVTDAVAVTFQSSPSGIVRFDNIDIAVDDPSLTEYAYNGSNELLRMTEDGVPTAFTYDAWGRTTLKTMNGYTAAYQYRYGDKLKRVDSTFPGENALVQYMYDGLGKRRIRQVDTTIMTYYRWNGWNEYSEYLQGSGGFWDMGDTAQRTYLPGLGEAYSAGSSSMADYTYWTTDHLGSVRGIYMQDRTPYGRYAYDPYGQTRLEAGLPLNVGFTGHIWDACIQQYFAPFRYYNPAAARWTMRDPLGYKGGGVNFFVYVNGQVIGNIDSMGLANEEVDKCKAATDLDPATDGWLVTRPIDIDGYREKYGSFSPYFHSYFVFDNGDAFWLNPNGTVEPESPNYKEDADYWPMRKKKRGKMPDGTPCKSASIEQIRKCLRENPATGTYKPSSGRCCNSQNIKGRKRCCLK